MARHVTSALVYALGFFVLWLCNYKVGSSVFERIPDAWSVAWGSVPPYEPLWLGPVSSFGLWFAVACGPLLIWRREDSYTSQRAFITVLLCFAVAAMAVSIFHFGVGINWLVQCSVLATVCATAEAIRVYRIGKCLHGLNPQARIAKIDKIYDRWFRYFGYILAVGFVGLLSISVQIFLSWDARVIELTVLPYAAIIGYTLLVICFRCLWPALAKTIVAENLLFSVGDDYGKPCSPSKPVKE